MGNYAEAEPLFKHALEIRRTALGEDHPNFAQSMNSLAGLYESMGNYAEAEPLFKHALEIWRTALGEDHSNFASSLNNLAHLYQSMGNYAEAEPLYKHALEITRTALGEDHPHFASSLNNLALLYHSMGNYADAEPLYKHALEILRRAPGEDHPDFASSLNNLAGLYESKGNYAEAEPLFKHALEILRRALGEDHPDFASSLNNLAGLYKSKGNYAEAEPLYKHALEIRRTALGEDHPDFATSLNNLALLYAATDHEREAYELMQRAQAIDDHMIGQVFSIGSETQRMAYLSKVRVNEERYMSLILQYFSTSSSAVQTALDLILRRKAIGAEAFATQRDAVLGGKYPELRNQLKKLSSLRMQIALKTLAGPGPEGIQAHLELMAEWKAQKEHLESELARQIPEMNLEQQVRAADRRAVSSSMPPGSTLIEFVRFDVFNFKTVPARNESQWKPAHYLVFTMPAGEPESVELIDLGEAEPIDRLIAEFRATITGEDELRAADRATTIGWGRNGLPDATSKSSGLLARLFKSPKRPVSESEVKERDLGAVAIEPASDLDNSIGNSLRSSLFDPLLAAIGECTHLLIAPDSNLSMLPFEVLPTEIGKRLIDQYYISYLSVGRDILRFHAESSGQPASPLIVADPAFDLSTSKKGVQAEMFPSKSRQSRDLDRSNIYFSPLPGTRREGEELAKMLGIQPWLDSKALEGKLKATTSPQILHIATHGFFLKDQKRDLNKEMRDLGAVDWASGSDMGRLSGAGMENPLLRSGIALAGVNTWLKHGSLPPEAEDGILTAEDVSGLDLLATDLVVLSACETGLGKVHVGEGVFGLRRAFMLAGAKTLVMSLWKVPDQQTQELMEDFYRRIMSGQARAEALREAQLAMKAKYPDPKYWGGFICQGDPGPIRFEVKY
jgi:tetratricopeptide (TPR) repeat protein